jgi:hypothetical protein
MKNDRGAGTRFYKISVIFSPKLKVNVVDVYLKLVLASLSSWGWVEKINRENLSIQYRQLSRS